MKFSNNFKQHASIALLVTGIAAFSHTAFAENEKPSIISQATESKITLENLGEFKLSVKKFTSMKDLDAHHQHLLDEANNTKNSPILRYTYALLLGINEPTELTRNMAIEALNKLEKEPSLSTSDKQTLHSIKNLMLYKKQNTEEPQS